MFSENLTIKLQSMQNPKIQVPRVTIDDIEFDQPRFQILLATYGELF